MEDVPEPVGPLNSPPEVEADEMLRDQRKEETVLRLLAEIADGQKTILRTLQGENTTASRKAGRPLSFMVLFVLLGLRQVVRTTDNLYAAVTSKLGYYLFRILLFSSLTFPRCQ
jgi:hypothetical protein